MTERKILHQNCAWYPDLLY